MDQNQSPENQGFFNSISHCQEKSIYSSQYSGMLKCKQSNFQDVATTNILPELSQ